MVLSTTTRKTERQSTGSIIHRRSWEVGGEPVGVAGEVVGVAGGVAGELVGELVGVVGAI
jgi:hypothetical protein